MKALLAAITLTALMAIAYVAPFFIGSQLDGQVGTLLVVYGFTLNIFIVPFMAIAITDKLTDY